MSRRTLLIAIRINEVSLAEAQHWHASYTKSLAKGESVWDSKQRKLVTSFDTKFIKQMPRLIAEKAKIIEDCTARLAQFNAELVNFPSECE